MQLTYCGISYTSSNSAIETVATSDRASFLGQTYIRRRPVDVPTQPQFKLVYRGVPYTTGNDSQDRDAIARHKNLIGRLSHS